LGVVVKIRKIKKIIKTFEKSSLNQLDITVGKLKIHLQKPQNPVDFSDEENRKEAIPSANDPIWIYSPLVGTCYLKTTAEATPLVFLGKKVQKNEIVCLIETMKVFNEIKSPVDGIIVNIMAEDGCMVEYHQPLVAVKCND
jgi:acetyl-CoA carboxylase biotin carboxyl carrier protein